MCSNVLTMGRAKTFHSLLSAHHLIGAYFLTTESDKRMRLLTRLYGMWSMIVYTTIPYIDPMLYVIDYYFVFQILMSVH